MIPTWDLPGPDAPPDEIVHALRERAKLFTGMADIICDVERKGAALAREEACRLQCQAAVIEAMSALYDQLGLRAQYWGEFAERMRRFNYPF